MFESEKHWRNTRNHGVEGECLPMECMFAVEASLSTQMVTNMLGAVVTECTTGVMYWGKQ